MNGGGNGMNPALRQTVSDAPLSQAEMDAKMKALQSQQFQIPQGPGPQSGNSGGGFPASADSGGSMDQAQIDRMMKERQSQQFQIPQGQGPSGQMASDRPMDASSMDRMMKERMAGMNGGGGMGGGGMGGQMGGGGMGGQRPPQQRQSGARKDVFALYYSERDNVSRQFLGELHKTAFFKKFIILCVDKQGIKIPRCVRSLPTIIVPTKDGPRPLAGGMAMKWLEMAKQQSVPGNGGGVGGSGSGAGGGTGGNWTGSGTMEQFDNKIAYGLKPFGDGDQLSSWDSAGSGGYSQSFALWSNDDSQTNLNDNNGAGINSNYTPIGLKTESGESAGKGGGMSQGGMGHMSGGISGQGSLPGTGMETRVGSTVDQDYEQFMAMRDADPYIGKAPNRMGGGPTGGPPNGMGGMGGF